MKELNINWAHFFPVSLLVELNGMKFATNVLVGSVQIFVLENKLFAFLHVLGFEKLVELGLETFHDVFDSFLYLFASIWTALLNFFLEHEHFHHKFAVVDLCGLLDFDAPEFHHVDGSFEVV